MLKQVAKTGWDNFDRTTESFELLEMQSLSTEKPDSKDFNPFAAGLEEDEFSAPLIQINSGNSSKDVEDKLYVLTVWSSSVEFEKKKIFVFWELVWLFFWVD